MSSIKLESVDTLIEYKPVWMRYVVMQSGADEIKIKTAGSDEIIEFEFFKGYDNSRVRYVNRDTNEIIVVDKIPREKINEMFIVSTNKVSEREFCQAAHKFEFLEELQFFSCNYIFIPRLPNNIKVLRLGHKFFNKSLLQYKITLFVAGCCHENCKYYSLEESRFKDPEHCVFCRFQHKLNCKKCGMIDCIFSNLLESYANRNCPEATNIRQYKKFTAFKDKTSVLEEEYVNMLDKEVTFDELENYTSECKYCDLDNNNGLFEFY